jgi:hypothetical protein
MPPSPEIPSAILDLREQYRTGLANPHEVVESALKSANSNAGRNVYLAQTQAWTLREAEQLPAMKRVSPQLVGKPDSDAQLVAVSAALAV